MSFTPVLLAPWSTMLVTDVKQIDVKSRTDKSGISIDYFYEVFFTGLYDAFALNLYANSCGLPIYGEYAANSLGTIYVSNINVELAPGSQTDPDATVGGQGIAHYKATLSPITSDRLDLNPLDRPAIIETGGIDLTEVRRVDIKGNPIVNGAGDYYSNLPSFYIPGCQINITTNLNFNPASLVRTYSNSMNQNSWYGVNAGQGRIGIIRSRKVIEKYAGADVTYYPMTVPILTRSDSNGWNYCPLNYGGRYRPKANQPVQAFIDPSGIHANCFLNADGTLLNPDGSGSPAAPAVFPAPSGGSPGGYQVLQSLDWSGLGLPNPFI